MSLPLEAPKVPADATDVSPARTRRWSPVVAIAAFSVLPVAFAAWQLGRWHPDEVYQYLEPAWRRVHGFGVVAWEWEVGLRNWAAPIVLSWFIRLTEAIGIHDPRGIRAVIAVPVLALQVGLLIAAYRYVQRRLGPTGWPTVFAWLLVAAMGPVLQFCGRTMGETFSTALLVMAVDRLDRSRESGTRIWIADGLWGGVLLGLSVVARYGSAVFVLAALVWLVATRRFRTLGACCVGGALIALGLGALDQATWGAPFHSLRAYIEFNLLSGHAEAQFGREPWWFYLPFLAYWMAPWAWPGTVASVLRERRLPLPTWLAIPYVLAIGATPHKESRFLYPALVLFALGAAPGLVALLRERVGSIGKRRALAVAALVSGWLFFLGAPDFRGDEFRAYVRATRSPEATGILVSGEGRWGSGGYFYLGRAIPLYNAALPE
ncbi:MAG: mannosyltransferase, partial [Myxococcaceae bacterium]|nr:mannosyltransferase [Myxococcaceae bacterium]